MADYLTALRQLLANESVWLDSTAVGRRLDPTSDDPKAVAAKARREQRVFAAWDGHHFHYPAFQFEPSGGIRPQLSKLMDVLPKQEDGSVGLDAVFWVFSPDNAFGGKSPVEVFPYDPTRIIEEARLRLEGGRD